MELITFKDSIIRKENLMVTVTGHMIDRENRTIARFPACNITFVRQKLTAFLNELTQKYGSIHLILSATKGVDLLAIEWAIVTKNPVDIFLPQDEFSFLNQAVNYGTDGPEWLELYQKAKQTKHIQIHTPVSIDNPTLQFVSPSSQTNQHYVDLYSNREVSELVVDDIHLDKANIRFFRSGKCELASYFDTN